MPLLVRGMRPTPVHVRRTLAVGGCLAAAGVLLAVRLADIQLLQGPRLRRLAYEERVARVPLLPVRGRILARDGTVLAMDVTTYAAYADPFLIRHPRADARLLSGPLHMPASTLASLLAQPTGFVWLRHGLSYGAYRAARGLGLEGIFFSPEEHRLYPQGSLMEPALGFVNADGQGEAGVEEYYNRQLRGRAGYMLLQTDALGRPLASQPAVVHPGREGDTLVLTLDPTIQSFAVRALNQAVRRTHSRSGRVLVMDPRTGAILAMAQFPVGNPRNYGRYPLQDWTDQLVEDAYYPGSTFKPVTAAAGLWYRVFTPASTWYDSGVKVIDGVTLHGWEWPKKFGLVTFDRAVALSSDIAFWDIGLALGARRLEAFARRLSLLSPTGVDLPGESPGLWIPWRSARPLDTAEMAFGQGQVLTPVQLAAAIAAIADGGVWHRPHVGLELLSPHGRVVAHLAATRGKRVMPSWVARDVVQAMEHVISPEGTGALAAVPGYRLAGKTGTSQVISSRQGFTGDYVASFVGYGPLPHPRVLVLVQLNHPQGLFYGGDIAAPVFARVMGETLHYLGIPPQKGALRLPVVPRVPSLVGLPLSRAVRQLLAAGYLPVLRARGWKVVRQWPKAGTPLVPGRAVRLSLGRTSTPAPVPRLQGLTVREAVSVLLAEGFRVRTVGSGLVARQRPLPGTIAPRKGTVTLWGVLSLPPGTSGG